MTSQALLHHLFPWEIAPGIPRDEESREDDHGLRGAPA